MIDLKMYCLRIQFVEQFTLPTGWGVFPEPLALRRKSFPAAWPPQQVSYSPCCPTTPPPVGHYIPPETS